MTKAPPAHCDALFRVRRRRVVQNSTVIASDLAAGYAAMAADEAREQNAEAWSEGRIIDVAAEPPGD